MNVAPREVRDTATFAEYTWLVRKLANALAVKMPANVELDDLIQAGLLGLHQSVARYDPANAAGASFETFASKRIRGAMLDEARAQDFLPRSLRDEVSEIDAATRRVERVTGKRATDAEIASEMGVHLNTYHEQRARSQGVRVVHIEDLNDGDFFDTFPAELSDTPEDRLEAKRTEEAVSAAIARLPEREKYIVERYFREGARLSEIAVPLKVSESRVSRLLAQALARLREKLT